MSSRVRLLAALTCVALSSTAQSQTVTAPEGHASHLDGQAPSLSPGRIGGMPLCLESIRNQNGGPCIQANSLATFGQLFPYPGLNNLFTPQAFVGGGESNSATKPWSTVAGGQANSATGQWATVGGGRLNRATSSSDTVGGGSNNLASGIGSTVAGGSVNTAAGQGATIAGGLNNKVPSFLAYWATIGGGHDNTLNGSFGAVPGGGSNLAGGTFSFAAGRSARATHEGSFVWGDANSSSKNSSASNQFNVYASGGVRMFTNSAATAGVLLAAGSGSWSSVSDRAAKENLERVDASRVLQSVLDLPIATWNYKAQNDTVRHMGPMAQDFHAAFGLGVSAKLIDTIDPDGVALAAIQGLNSKLDSEVETLREERDAMLDAQRSQAQRIEDPQRELSALREQMHGVLAALSSSASSRAESSKAPNPTRF